MVFPPTTIGAGFLGCGATDFFAQRDDCEVGGEVPTSLSVALLDEEGISAIEESVIEVYWV
tara:strand:+ start:6437 stop:6619 length:183 start_codon:yes stop_codon:yes gene_type:complete